MLTLKIRRKFLATIKKSPGLEALKQLIFQKKHRHANDIFGIIWRR
jgi:hypothetical protein